MLSSAFENGVLKREALVAEWESRRVNRPNDAKGFSGPDDPKFVDAVTQRYTSSLKSYEHKLKELLESKP